jgi:hypothetical protein
MKHLMIENGIRINKLPIACDPVIYDFYPKDGKWWTKARHQFKTGVMALIDVFHFLK